MLDIQIIDANGSASVLRFDSSGAALAWLLQSGFIAGEFDTWVNPETLQEAIV
jgi:hypothetical protein